MSDLHDRAFNLAVEKHGFHINDGNRDAVYAIVDLVSEQQQQTILDLNAELEAAREVVKAVEDIDKYAPNTNSYYVPINFSNLYDNLHKTIKSYNKAQGGKKENPIGESLAKEIHDQGR